MSFHLPHRGLPQELRDMIYRHALCPPEGLTIRTEFDKRDSKKAPDSLFGCQPPIASGLLRTNRQVYDATLPILYRENVFSLKMRCFNALQLLRSLPKQNRLLIKNIHLPNELMAPDENHNRQYAEELCRFLIDDMRLENITLAVPDGMEASSGSMDMLQYERFTWTLTLHEILIKAFHEGHFQSLRFVHPKFYFESFCCLRLTRTTRIERMLMGDYQCSVDKRRDLYWDSYYAAQRNGTVCRDTVDALREFENDIRRRAGYVYEHDGSRPGEKGTVMVFRRVATSLKRPHKGDGFSSEMKRSRDFGREDEAGGEEREG